MSYRVEFTSDSLKEVKDLSKKYHSFKADLSKLIEKLTDNPYIGTSIGNGCYKIRLAISSKNKGKSAGARVITHIVLSTDNDVVYIVSVYDKSEQSTISQSEIKYLLSRIK